MTTPMPIETFEDILAAMENNPRLQAAMRQHILDQEFLQLPAIVRELQQAVAQLTQLVHDYIAATDARLDQIEVHLDNIEGHLDKIEGDVAEIKDQQTTMSGQITSMSGQIANLVRSDYESKAIQGSKRLIRRNLAMVTATVVHAGRWNSQPFEENMLRPAIAEGRINRQQADQLEDADCIIQCEDQNGNIVHALAEFSINVRDTDRRRAAERAEILAAATGTRAVPFVVGQEQELPGAGAPNVAFLEYTG